MVSPHFVASWIIDRSEHAESGGGIHNAIAKVRLRKSCGEQFFYGTEIKIWASFEPVVNTEKKIANFEQILKPGFYVFMGKQN